METLSNNKDDGNRKKSEKMIFIAKALISISVMVLMIASVSAASLSDHSILFNNNETFSGIIILGKNAQQNDYLSATEIVISAAQKGNNNNDTAIPNNIPIVLINAEVIKTDAEAGDWKDQNTIVIGGPCSNQVTAQLLESTTMPDDCSKNFTPGRAVIKMFQHPNGKVSILIAGYSGEDTLMAARVFAYRGEEISGDEVTVVGTNYVDARILTSKNQQEIKNLIGIQDEK